MKTYLRAVVFLATLLLSALVATPALATISAAPRAAMIPTCASDGPCDPGPPCYSTSCAGLAPDGRCESNVSNLFKDDSTPIRAILEIRHSGYCNSNWARLRFLDTSDCKMTGVAIQRRSYSNGSWHLGGIQSATRGLQAQCWSYWTKMVGGSGGQVRVRTGEGYIGTDCNCVRYRWHAWSAWKAGA